MKYGGEHGNQVHGQCHEQPEVRLIHAGLEGEHSFDDRQSGLQRRRAEEDPAEGGKEECDRDREEIGGNGMFLFVAACQGHPRLVNCEPRGRCRAGIPR